MIKGHTVNQPPHGHVRYIDHLGSDQRIVESARVSYQSPSKGEEADKKLLHYLWKNRHTSPFEQCNITFNIKMPIFIMRQFVRHRTFKLNEWSGRYSELSDEFFVPSQWREQLKKGNKQGSAAPGSFDIVYFGANNSRSEPAEVWQAKNKVMVDDFHRHAYDIYNELLHRGVAKELARVVLPVSIYTEIYVNCDLHNLLHFLTLRTDSHAQQEIQDVANAMLLITKSLFPWTIEAWENFKFKIIETQEKS